MSWRTRFRTSLIYLVSIVATHDRQRLTGAANMTRHSDPRMDERTVAMGVREAR